MLLTEKNIQVGISIEILLLKLEEKPIKTRIEDCTYILRSQTLTILEAAEYKILDVFERAISLTCVSPGGMSERECAETATGPLLVRPDELNVFMHLLGSSRRSHT